MQNQLAKCVSHRFVQMSGEIAAELVPRDQLDDIGEILVRTAQVGLP
jgi:hypothetical protein